MQTEGVSLKLKGKFSASVRSILSLRRPTLVAHDRVPETHVISLLYRRILSLSHATLLYHLSFRF